MSSRRREYGERFATIVAHGSVFGVQFHPEKSSADGLALLAQFVAHAARVDRVERLGEERVILLPAIDILDGKAVRLAQGDFDQQTVYDADPLDAALRWVQDGARSLHIVDLDGARSGVPANLAHVERIARAVDVPIQFGGGLRNVEAVVGGAIGRRDARDSRDRRVARLDFLDEVVALHGEHVVVSVDGRRWDARRGGLDRTDARSPSPRWSSASERAACADSSTRASIVTGC